MALVNQQQVANGGSPLGFINSQIYNTGVGSGYGAAFHDITSGNNDCCGQSVWYSAVTGYDLVTGWGSPNGVGLAKALVTAPGFSMSISPSSQTIGIYGQASYAVTVTAWAGFDGTVTLGASCSGLSCGISPGSVTGGGNATLTVGDNGKTGTFQITASGTYGSTYKSATATLVVN